MSGTGDQRMAAEARLARYLADGATAEDLALLHRDLADPRLAGQGARLLAIDRLLPLALGGDGAAFAAEVGERLAATPASRRRFTRGVMRSVRRRQGPIGRAWPILAAAAALLLGWWLIPFSSDARVPPPPSTGVHDDAGVALRPGEVIEATTDRAVVCRDGTRLALTPGTRLAIEDGSDRGGWRFRLSRGAVTASVAPQPPDQGLRIATPHAEATVVGTRFRLAVAADRSRLEVTEGRVALRSASGERQVGPGEASTADAVAGPTLERWCFTFADGIVARADATWWLGTLVTRGDGRRVLASQSVIGGDGAWHGCRVTLADAVSTPSWRLRFRVEAIPGTELVVQPHNWTQGQNYQIHVPAAAGGEVIDLDLALDQGRAVSDPVRRWNAGDVLDEVLIYQPGTDEGGLVLQGFSVLIR